MRTALTIAGSDSSGGAGIQADIKTMSAIGVYAMSVITSVVAENTQRVLKIEDVSEEMIKSQIDSVYEDIVPNSVKIGMLYKEETTRAVYEGIKKYAEKCPYIVADPVMYAKDGTQLMSDKAQAVFRNNIMPLIYLVTPNIPEAEVLADMKIQNVEDMKKAAQIIAKSGAKVLVKGGHNIGEAIDILYDGKNFYEFKHPRINTRNTHGTGCTLSSAITAELALGKDIVSAVRSAKEYITGAIENSLELGKGNGPLNHFYKSKKAVDYTLYVITDRRIMSDESIEVCVEKAIKGGAGIIQLREKETSEEEFIKIAEGVKRICTKFNVPLIINDNVNVMKAVNADGIHIGQKDGSAKEMRKLIGENKILGVSTATVEEAVKAEKDGADYIGVGAVFATSTKTNTRSVTKQTICEITKSVNIPVVLIGGIKADNVENFKNCSISGVAVVSAVVSAEDVKKASEEMYKKVRQIKER